jgi:hypothetical protein
MNAKDRDSTEVMHALDKRQAPLRNRRQEERGACRNRARVVIMGEKIFNHGVVYDATRSGIGIIAPEYFEVGAKLFVKPQDQGNRIKTPQGLFG